MTPSASRYEEETADFLAPFVLAYRAEQEGGKATFVPFAQVSSASLSSLTPVGHHHGPGSRGDLESGGH